MRLENFLLNLLAVFLILPVAAAQENTVTASEKALMDNVWNALNAEPGLVNHHRGFLAYVESHPQLAKALAAAGPLERHPVLQHLIASFHTAVEQDRQSQDLFYEFYSSLAADEQLREAVDSLYRVELAVNSHSVKTAFVHLNGDPDNGLRFLANPAKPAPIVFNPLRMAFKTEPGLREELSYALGKLHKMPAAHSTVFPWWRKLAADTGAVSQAYGNLTAELTKQPHRFWIWHTAQIELAKDVQAWRWIRYWQRRVRHENILSLHYHAYLDIIGRHPDYARAAADAWQSKLGPAPAWPPESLPPVPPATPASKPAFQVEMPSRPKVEKPVPHMPDMPRMPVVPAKPKKPDYKAAGNIGVP